MVTIKDNRSCVCKTFEDIPEYEYFMCNENLYIKIPMVMVDYGGSRCFKNAIRINHSKTLVAFADYYSVEPVDLCITINNPKN